MRNVLKKTKLYNSTYMRYQRNKIHRTESRVVVTRVDGEKEEMLNGYGLRFAR